MSNHFNNLIEEPSVQFDNDLSDTELDGLLENFENEKNQFQNRFKTKHSDLIENLNEEWGELRRFIEAEYRRELERKVCEVRETYQKLMNEIGEIGEVDDHLEIEYSQEMEDIFITSPSQNKRIEKELRKVEKEFWGVGERRLEEELRDLIEKRKRGEEDGLREYERSQREERVSYIQSSHQETLGKGKDGQTGAALER